MSLFRKNPTNFILRSLSTIKFYASNFGVTNDQLQSIGWQLTPLIFALKFVA